MFELVLCTHNAQADWCVDDTPPPQHVEPEGTLAPFAARWVRQAVGKGGSSGSAGPSEGPAPTGMEEDPETSTEEC